MLSRETIDTAFLESPEYKALQERIEGLEIDKEQLEFEREIFEECVMEVAQGERKIRIGDDDEIYYDPIKSTTDLEKLIGKTVNRKRTFSDIAGYKDLISQVQDDIDSNIDLESAQRHGYDPLNIIVIEGPSGTGKSMLAEAIANEMKHLLETGVEYFTIKNNKLKGIYVNEGPARIDAMFTTFYERYEQTGIPIVLAINEGDSALMARGSGPHQSEEDNKATTSMLEWIEEIQVRKGLYLIITTNRTDIIDQAALRPGRTGLVYKVGLPKDEDRAAIFQHYLDLKRENNGYTIDVDMQKITRASDGLSGATIGAVVNSVVRENAAYERRSKRAGNFEERLTIATPQVLKYIEAAHQHTRQRSHLSSGHTIRGL